MTKNRIRQVLKEEMDGLIYNIGDKVECIGGKHKGYIGLVTRHLLADFSYVAVDDLGFIASNILKLVQKATPESIKAAKKFDHIYSRYGW